LLLARQFTHLFAVLLWVAAALAGVAGLAELAVAIVVVVVVNGVFAFAQEFRADHAAERLRDLMPVRATVVRDGTARLVPAVDLVPGDVVLLEAGDRISADLRLEQCLGLAVDESLLTGESVARRPADHEPAYAGTFVLEGSAQGQVLATGARTRLAAIAALTGRTRRPRSPLADRLDRVVSRIAMAAVAVGAVFFGLSVSLGLEPVEGFLLALGVTVALIPEGLLPTVTLSLARGARSMAMRRALVKHLEAVETLGSVTFVCTDKTGTLTRNEMAAVQVWTADGVVHVSGEGYEPTATVVGAPRLLDAVAYAAARASTGRAAVKEGAWVASGDPMEAALHVLALRAHIDVAGREVAEPTRLRYPFDPRRRCSSAVVGDTLYCKGAPEAVLGRCTEPGQAFAVAAAMANQGLRVLAVAARVSADVGHGAEADEQDLTLLGLVGLVDPPRPDVVEAVRACQEAHINLAMITGDHPGTARAVASDIGIIPANGLVVDAHELPSDDPALGALLDREGVVIARASPEDKLRIARALQARGHVVAMTGDGVNDAPALRKADVGVAMGRSGSDVAREAADLVLLDDHFGTIVAAVRLGRATFANIRRFLTYHLTDNVAELAPFVLWALSGGRFPLAIGVLQVLALDIGTDLLPALALGAEPPGRHVMHRPAPSGQFLDRRVIGRAFGLLGPAEVVASLGAFTLVLLAGGWSWGAVVDPALLARASGTAFAAIVLGQLANVFACRSETRYAFRLDPRTNRLVMTAVVVELILLAVFLGVPPVADTLGGSWPDPTGWLLALLAVPAILVVDTLAKRWSSPAAGTHTPAPRGRHEHADAKTR
jgi:calcium-translocating P-type ATPase